MSLDGWLWATISAADFSPLSRHDAAFARALAEAVVDLSDNDDVKVVVLRAISDDFAPPTAPAAPHSLADTLTTWEQDFSASNAIYQALCFSKKITMTEVVGRCLGAGSMLVLTTDLTVASADAEFGAPFLAGWLVTGLAGDPVRLGAWRFAAGGVLLALFAGWNGWSLWLFGRHGTGLLPGEPTTAMIEQGPYRLSRNPLYVGLLALYVALALLVPTLWGLALLPAAVLLVRWGAILPEEEHVLVLTGTDHIRVGDATLVPFAARTGGQNGLGEFLAGVARKANLRRGAGMVIVVLAMNGAIGGDICTLPRGGAGLQQHALLLPGDAVGRGGKTGAPCLAIPA